MHLAPGMRRRCNVTAALPRGRRAWTLPSRLLLALVLALGVAVDAQQVLCPCEAIHTYCKYDDHPYRLWPYRGVCYETFTACDCLSCPDLDPTKNNPCRNHTSPSPAPPTPTPPTTTTTTTPKPGLPVYVYAPDCLSFYDHHSNDSRVDLLRWDDGLAAATATAFLHLLGLYAPPDAVAAAARGGGGGGFAAARAFAFGTNNRSNSTTHAPARKGTTAAATTTAAVYPPPARAFPKLPLRVFLDALAAAALVGTLVLCCAVECVCVRVRVGRSCAKRGMRMRRCAYFGLPLRIVAWFAAVGLLFAVPSVLLFVITAPVGVVDANGGGGGGGGNHSAGGGVGDGNDHRSLLERFVEDQLDVQPLRSSSSSAGGGGFGGVNATVQNIACSLVFEPLNPWALLCLLGQLMYVVAVAVWFTEFLHRTCTRTCILAQH